eukprot:TRINITY_DN1550_c0_g2_i5.p1 TRINITY_DN1550_c0_g2~~TRINITY_DN1550_c0_g2_i5.p1  ORF type:complete len:1053 (+),score=73.48 TRINITY_DN1550_c0_g2_i5:560-3718(+)
MGLLRRGRGPLSSVCYSSVPPILLVLLLLLLTSLRSTLGVTINAHDYAAMVEVKAAFEPFNTTLDSWNASVPCEDWLGIKCDSKGYVTDINLATYSFYAVNLTLLEDGNRPYSDTFFYQEFNLDAFEYSYEYVGSVVYDGPINGSLSPFVGNLSRLETLSVVVERLKGAIPAELGKLSNLKLLNLSVNNLDGPIPSTIGDLSELIALDLSQNARQGEQPVGYATSINNAIPEEIGKCTKLKWLNLGGNNFSGPVPSSFANLSNLKFLNVQGSTNYPGLTGRLSNWLTKNLTKLEYLDLSINELAGIVPTFGGTNLTFIDLSQNILSGDIPEELGRQVKLRYLDLSTNNFTLLPQSIGNLSSLTYLSVGVNFLGAFPASVSELSNLEYFSMVNCGIAAAFPNITQFTHLTYLDMSFNFLTNDGFPTAISTFANLTTLVLDFNDFHGASFPDFFAGLSQLTTLSCKSCNLSGPLPLYLGLLHGLTKLDLGSNDFHGPIPSSFGGIGNLTILDLSANSLNGSLPSELGNLAYLTYLDLSSNKLQGSLPTELRNIPLEYLDLHSNRLTSVGKVFLIQSFSLHYLDLSDNLFVNPIPESISNIRILQTLILSNNGWGGSLPVALASCNALLTFLCRNCGLQATLPYEIGNLLQLQILDLGQNSFTGSLGPQFFENFTAMQYLSLGASALSSTIPNVSTMVDLLNFDLGFNRFEGPLPPDFPSKLQALDLSYNKLDAIPAKSLRSLPQALSVELGYNLFSGALPFVNTSSNLSYISFAGNEFKSKDARVPAKYANITTDLSGNPLCSSISSALQTKFCNNVSNPHEYNCPAICPTANCTNGTVASLYEYHFGSGACICVSPVIANISIYPAFVKYYSAAFEASIVQYFSSKTRLSTKQIWIHTARTGNDATIVLGLYFFGLGQAPLVISYRAILQALVGSSTTSITNVGFFKLVDFALPVLSSGSTTTVSEPVPSIVTIYTRSGVADWVLIVSTVIPAIVLLVICGGIGLLVYSRREYSQAFCASTFQNHEGYAFACHTPKLSLLVARMVPSDNLLRA